MVMEFWPKGERCGRCGAVVYGGVTEADGVKLGTSCHQVKVLEEQDAVAGEVKFRFCLWPAGETCSRCGGSISSGWVVDGAKVGPTCGKAVLREHGVTWPAGFGPGAFDAMAMARAVQLQNYGFNKWLYAAAERKVQEEVVGVQGWRIAQAIAQGLMLELELQTEDVLRCYRAAWLGLAPTPPRAWQEEERRQRYEARLSERAEVYGWGGRVSETFLDWEDKQV